MAAPSQWSGFKAHERHAFFGKCLVVIQSGKTPATISLTAKGVDLESQTIEIKSK